MPSLYSARAGYEIVARLASTAIRAHSLPLTRRLIDVGACGRLPAQYALDDHERGGSVIIDVPDGAASPTS